MEENLDKLMQLGLSERDARDALEVRISTSCLRVILLNVCEYSRT